jgi:hypothetical protein
MLKEKKPGKVPGQKSRFEEKLRMWGLKCRRRKGRVRDGGICEEE